MNESEPKLVSVTVTEERIRELLKGERDFIVSTTEDGYVLAVCKACQQVLEIAQDEMLAWFRCPSCALVSFNPLGNVHRDMQLARKDGQPFVYELYYARKLPPELTPPFEKKPSPSEH